MRKRPWSVTNPRPAFGCKVARCPLCRGIIRLKPATKRYCDMACNYRAKRLTVKWGITMDLFETVAEEKRRRLEALGWQRQPGKLKGWPCWQDPEGKVVPEDKAFDRLDGLERKKEGGDV